MDYYCTLSKSDEPFWFLTLSCVVKRTFWSALWKARYWHDAEDVCVHHHMVNGLPLGCPWCDGESGQADGRFFLSCDRRRRSLPCSLPCNMMMHGIMHRSVAASSLTHVFRRHDGWLWNARIVGQIIMNNTKRPGRIVYLLSFEAAHANRPRASFIKQWRRRLFSNIVYGVGKVRISRSLSSRCTRARILFKILARCPHAPFRIRTLELNVDCIIIYHSLLHHVKFSSPTFTLTSSCFSICV